MSKTFDIKRTLGNPSPPLSIEAVEEMTQLIHGKKEAPVSTEIAVAEIEKEPIQEISTIQAKKISKQEKTNEDTEKGKRGRKLKEIMETERLLRVSVDLPESVFIQLKILMIQQQTDMKGYIRKLVEKDLARKG